ncbi:small-conductance mechanosensitive channel [Constrictibacter sp. MBR-5]|jgi:small conductance mechanosensitive channel|uniref:mechanosensitive ion channel domain-containing protein n=1 Tax=Constrictibacter sp. MBR-5 TaxID=3156467 RepID=UPI003393D7C2
MQSTASTRPAVGSSRPFVAPLLALFLFLLPLAALAQVPQQAPQQAPPAAQLDQTVAELEALVGTLTDDAAREQLVGQLRTLIEARKATATPQEDAGSGAEFLAQLADEVGRIGQQFVGAAEFVVDLPQIFTWATTGAGDPATRKALWDFATALVVVLAAAIATEWMVRRVLLRPRRAVESRHHDRLVVRLSFVAVRLILDLLPVLAFALVAHAAMAFLDPPWRIRLAVLALVQANVIVRLIGVAARSLLAPEFASLRLLGVGDQTAQYIYIWVRRIAAVAVYGYFFIEALYALGAPYDVYTVMLKLLGFVVTVLMIVLILQNRAAVAAAIRGTGQSGGMRTLRARFGDVWHVFAITYVVVVFAIWAVQLEQGFSFLFRATLLTVGVLLLSRLIAAIVRQLLERGFAISPDVKTRYPGIEERANRYVPVLRCILLGTVYAVTVLALLEVWGLDAFGWVASESGRHVVGGAAKIVIVVFIALVAWALLSAAIERYLNSADMDGNVIQRSQRVRTLLPLMQKTAFVGITIIAGLIVLSEIGIDIGPLLAGAGIIGLAVGFGAQTLVKDIITGIFILVENQFSVGDVVNVGGNGGLVEAISIRTIRLRGYDGTVFTVPFSEVGSTANLTKEFSYYVADVGVAYREDTDQVVAVLRAILDEMIADPDFGSKILAPLDVAGVDKFDESAVIVKVRIKTLPIQQWGVGREFNRRMKKKFDELGIEIPFPHRTIYFGVDKSGGAPPARIQVDDRARTLASAQTVALPGKDATGSGDGTESGTRAGTGSGTATGSAAPNANDGPDTEPAR